MESAYSNLEEERTNLVGRLRRTKRLFELGDYTEAEYVARRDDLLRQMEALESAPDQTNHLNKLAQFLANVPAAWGAATQEQRNKLARALFDQVWLEDKTVVAVKPRPELEPFFRLNYEDYQRKNIEDQTSTRVELYCDPTLPRPWALNHYQWSADRNSRRRIFGKEKGQLTCIAGL